MIIGRGDSFNQSRWWMVVLAIGALPLMINNDSLWIDEGATAYRISHTSFSAWWHNIITETDGDSLQPLGMFFLWLAGRFFGTAEWQLRSINVIWGALTLLLIWRAGKNLKVEWLPLLFAVQPFFWLYTNEARPYALQNACGAGLLYSFACFLKDEGQGLRWSVAFVISGIALCYSTMLAPLFLVPLVLVGAFAAWRNSWKPKLPLGIVALAFIAPLPAGFYYLQLLRRGASGAKLWDVDLRYFGYVAYEFVGATGLGPASEELRSLARNIHQASANPNVHLQIAAALLFIFFIAITFCSLVLGDEKGDARRVVGLLLGPVLLEIAILFLFGWLIRKNFWPRHLSVAFPFYVAALGVALSWIYHAGGRVMRIVAVLSTGMMIWSSLEIRYSPSHSKEAYRSAANAALSESRSGHVVWWVANKFAANYYGLKLVSSDPKPGEAFSPEEAHREGLSAKGLTPPQADDIFISRPDVHDKNGDVQKLLRDSAYHLKATYPAFKWWTR